jgi:heptosyltransferase-2
VNKRTIAFDCRYFRGDRPCKWHKLEGVLCRCDHYSHVEKRILLIKLDAMGDVLRTTCILPALKELYPGSMVTWITREESVPLLVNNPFIDEILPYGSDSLVNLGSSKYELVINLDAGKISSGLAAIAKASKKEGYVLHQDGYVQSTNEAARRWLEMGVFDDLKKENRQTYQEMICSIIGIVHDGSRYVLNLTSEELDAGGRHLANIGLDPEKQTLGIHTGGGGRWVNKQWTETGFIELIRRFNSELPDSLQILLFGGPMEKERNARILEKTGGNVFYAGWDNPVRHFAAMVAECSVLLTGDSLAMHLSLALGRRTVVLFGPTSSAEIEMFGLGEKLIPDEMDCLVCYLRDCDISPNCMERISVEIVKQAVLRQLEMAEKGR